MQRTARPIMRSAATLLLLALSGLAAATPQRLRAEPLLTLLASAPAELTCGALPTYPNASPRNYEDTSKKTFSAGAKIPFSCEKGFTTDGTKDGPDSFQVECNKMGSFNPDGVCLAASKCGPLPQIAHAAPTGETNGNLVQFSCSKGYSLNGEPVLEGGTRENALFTVECNPTTSLYAEFRGECKPFGFMPAKESIKIHNQVFEAFFHVSCKGTLKTAFRNGEPPAKLLDACAKLGAADHAAECQALVKKVTDDFQAKLKKRQEIAAQANPDLNALPNVEDESDVFCKKLWAIVQKP